MYKRFHARLEVTESGRVAVDLLSQATGLSKQQVKRAMTSGAVWLSNGAKARRVRRAKTVLKPGDSVDLYYDERVLAIQPPAPGLIADEGAYSVWYKPFGMLAQGSKWGDHSAITRAAEKAMSPERPALVVHRIDRAATGLMLLAHQKKAAAGLSGLFQRRAVEKIYRAKVHGKVEIPYGGLTVVTPIDGREASSMVELVAYDEARNCSLVDVDIETGRKHQIRIHLAGIGHPIIGDRLYGNGDGSADLQLAAYRLAFVCPLSGLPKRYQLAADKLPHF